MRIFSIVVTSRGAVRRLDVICGHAPQGEASEEEAEAAVLPTRVSQCALSVRDGFLSDS